jgi:DNA polymerase elongation subunit (family B)
MKDSIQLYEEFSVEDLGVCEEWVYDIEVENNHNFFGNNILVHNSIYFSLKPLLDKIPADSPYEKKVELMAKFCDGMAQEAISEFYEKLSQYVNTPINYMIMDREAISVRGGAFVAKKKYFLALDDMEGKRFSESEPYWKIVGMEAVKAGSYTKEIRSLLKEIIELIVVSDEETVQKRIAEFKSDFMKWEPTSISFLKGITEIDKFVLPSGGMAKGTPIHVRAAINYNKYIKEQGIDAPEIKAGDKLNYIHLKKPNPIMDDIIGFHSFKDIKGLEKYIDRELHWEKNVMSPINIMTSAVGFDSVKKNKLF